MSSGDAAGNAAESTAGSRQNKSNIMGRLPRMRLSTLLVLFFLSMFAMTVAFVGGVMTGRQSVSQSRTQVVAEKPADSTARAGVEANSEEVDSTILKPQELEFARVLRGEAKRPREVKEVQAAPAPQPARKEEPAKPKDEAVAAGQSPETQATEPAKAETHGVFDFVMQVGVFRDEEAADRLRQKLEGYGLRTMLERSGKAKVVLVRMRGDESRVGELEAIAHELRLGVPLLKSRKAVKN